MARNFVSDYLYNVDCVTVESIINYDSRLEAVFRLQKCGYQAAALNAKGALQDVSEQI